jgi:ribonuclease P protein component
VRHSGKKYAHPLVVVYITNSIDENPHCGIVTGKSIGNAVRRNLAKRRIRRIVSENLTRFKQARDIVIIARPSISNAKYSEIDEAIEELFQKAGLFS